MSPGRFLFFDFWVDGRGGGGVGFGRRVSCGGLVGKYVYR